jgi:hypothetical protein
MAARELKIASGQAIILVHPAPKGEATQSTSPVVKAVCVRRPVVTFRSNDVYQQFKFVRHTAVSTPIRIDAPRVELLSRFSLQAECQGVDCAPGFA